MNVLLLSFDEILAQKIAEKFDGRWGTSFALDICHSEEQALKQLAMASYNVVMADYFLEQEPSCFNVLNMAKSSHKNCVTFLICRDCQELIPHAKAKRQGIDQVISLHELTPKVLEIALHYLLEFQSIQKTLIKQQQVLTLLFKQAKLSELVTGLIHDINNPLAITIGKVSFAIKLLHQGASKEVIGNNLKAAQSSAERISSISKRIMAFSRQSPLDPPESLDLVKVIDDSLRLCQFRLRNSGVSIDIEVPETPLQVMGHPSDIMQIIINLVYNAIDAIEEVSEKAIKIRAYMVEDSAYITVSDSGTGVPPELRDQVLKPFFTTKPKNKGTGLGLSISSALAEKSDARLTLRNDTDQTTFELEFSPKFCKKMENIQRVLIIDDEPDILDCLREELEHTNLVVTTCSDMASAIQHLSQTDFKIVITDIVMPGGGGEDIYTWIQSHSANPPTVFFISGFPESAERVKSCYGHDQVLMKPFAPHLLVDRILSKI